MAKLSMTVLFLVILAPLGSGIPDQSPEAVQKWFENLPHAKQKLTKLHFYVHNTLVGNNLTVVLVAQANISSTSPTRFGQVYVMDAPLTVTPDPGSKMVGFSQGLYPLTSLQEESSVPALNFVFTDGEYNGSTLSLLGGGPISDKYREYPIVGGSGDFRLAQGIGTVQSYAIDNTTRNEILEFDFIFVHY